MSSKRRNLRIEVEQPGEQFNAKLQGYVQYVDTQQMQQPSQRNRNNNSIYTSRVSYLSNQSNVSNKSDRSSLLERAQQVMMENRLNNNLKILSKSRQKPLSKSKVKFQQYDHNEQSRIKIYKNNKNKQKQLPRSKSATALVPENSRAKMLKQIADKLKKATQFKQNHQNQNYGSRQQKKHYQISDQVSKTQSGKNSQNVSTVQKIKQIKQKMNKNRGGKLEHLLKDIKKSNKQAYKVVYTIRKSFKNQFAQEKNLQMFQRLNQQKLNSVIYNSTENQGTKNKEKSGHLKLLAAQLSNVRKQLSQVKNKNQELLKISRMRSANNSFIKNSQTVSQYSRKTQQIQTEQFDAASIASKNLVRVMSRNGSGQILFPSFNKLQEGAYLVQKPAIIQPCFACGCTCGGKTNKKV